MAGKSYVVTGPLATPYREDGTRVYLYEGSEFPDGLREGELERMVDLGLVGEATSKADDDESSAPAKKAAAKKAASSSGN